mmetsp:Transcript_59703/g.187249  ORF Transcript_59703/g.187249 Transcript_59703/m.187249 type:complete len:267 (-) Transcript_59703:1534-2334(-)
MGGASFEVAARHLFAHVSNHRGQSAPVRNDPRLDRPGSARDNLDKTPRPPGLDLPVLCSSGCDMRARGRGQGARLRGQFHAARRGGAGLRLGVVAEAGAHARAEGEDRGGDGTHPVRLSLRPPDARAAVERHWLAPCGPLAEVPAVGGAAGAKRAAGMHQRNGHPRRWRQRPHPHGPLHTALQVRRREDRHPGEPRLPPDSGPCWPPRVRRAGQRRGRGAGARRREHEARGSDRERKVSGGEGEAAQAESGRAHPELHGLGRVHLH